MPNQLWYAYETVDDGHYTLMTAGPVDEGKERSDGLSWEDPYLTSSAYDETQPLLFDFITAFDHEPTASETLALVPEEHKDAYTQMRDAEENDELLINHYEFSALSLAIQHRLAELQAIPPAIDPDIESAEVLEVIKACLDQQACLLSVARKLEMTLEENWPRYVEE